MLFSFTFPPTDSFIVRVPKPQSLRFWRPNCYLHGGQLALPPGKPT
jgi:hypothetical protein